MQDLTKTYWKRLLLLENVMCLQKKVSHEETSGYSLTALSMAELLTIGCKLGCYWSRSVVVGRKRCIHPRYSPKHSAHRPWRCQRTGAVAPRSQLLTLGIQDHCLGHKNFFVHCAVCLAYVLSLTKTVLWVFWLKKTLGIKRSQDFLLSTFFHVKGGDTDPFIMVRSALLLLTFWEDQSWGAFHAH